MNLLSFAVAAMSPQLGGVGTDSVAGASTNKDGSGGGGKDMPPDTASITIELDGDGGPQAKPDSAWVQPGGEIVWSCAKRFEVVLKLMWTGERVTRKSRPGEKGLEVVTTTAGATNGRYSYGIKVEGFDEVDPDVVIGPRSA